MSRLRGRSARRADEIRLADFPRPSNHLSVNDESSDDRNHARMILRE